MLEINRGVIDQPIGSQFRKEIRIQFKLRGGTARLTQFAPNQPTNLDQIGPNSFSTSRKVLQNPEPTSSSYKGHLPEEGGKGGSLSFSLTKQFIFSRFSWSSYVRLLPICSSQSNIYPYKFTFYSDKHLLALLKVLLCRRNSEGRRNCYCAVQRRPTRKRPRWSLYLQRLGIYLPSKMEGACHVSY